MIVRALGSTDKHKGLTPGREYVVIGVDHTSYRIVDDDADPVLYEKEYFEVVEPSIPVSWVRQDYDDGQYFIDPPELSGRGFYEAWHDRDEKARSLFASSYSRIVAEAQAKRR